MAPVERRLTSDSELQDLLLEAIQSLSRGETIAVPSPLGYLALRRGITPPDAATDSSAAADARANSPGNLQWSLALRCAAELRDYFAPLPHVAERMLDRSPPGSVLMEIPAQLFRLHPGSEAALFTAHPISVPIEQTHAGEFVRCRLLSGTIPTALQGLCPWPLLVGAVVSKTTLAAAGEPGEDAPPIQNGAPVEPGETPPNSADSLENLPSNCLNYIIIDTTSAGTPAGGPLAIVRIQGQGVTIIQSGQLADATLMERSGPSLLFVCTGNTCRSPMAEAICRKMLADRLNCDLAELSSRGIEICSAGIAADYGSPASPEAVHLLADEGIDLSQHQSQPLSVPMLDRFDWILTMTAQHRLVILNHRPDLADRVRVLGVGQKDIPDPFGGDLEVYRECRSAIEAGLQDVVDQIVREL